MKTECTTDISCDEDQGLMKGVSICQWRGNSDFWKAKRCLSSWKYSVWSSSWTQLCWQTGRKLRKKAGLALTHHPMDYPLKGFPLPKKIGQETGGRDQEHHMRKNSWEWSLSIINSPTQMKYSSVTTAGHTAGVLHKSFQWWNQIIQLSSSQRRTAYMRRMVMLGQFIHRVNALT